MDPILRKFRDKFFEEANTLLDHLEKDMLELEKMADNKELIESAFRAMHTIKGVSGMYGFEYISDFTHKTENLYQAVRENKLKFDKEIFDLTFLSIDHIRKLLSDESLSDITNQNNHKSLLNQIGSIIDDSDNVADLSVKENDISQIKELGKKNTWHIMLHTNEMIYYRGINIVSIFADLARFGEYQIVKLDYLSSEKLDTWSIILSSDCSENDLHEVFLFIEDDCIITRISENNLLDDENFIQRYLNTDHEGMEQSILDFIENSGKTNETIENTEVQSKDTLANKGIVIKTDNKVAIKRILVDSTKLDHLMYLVSELITVNSQLLIATHKTVFNEIKPLTEKVDALSKQFRNNALEIRLVPLSDTILRFQRLIRDLSQQLKKKIELVTQGIDTELDKNTIDQLNEPLMHIIRNCIDHGIEQPAKRIQKGKAETGLIKISAFNSGNYVVIKVEDDGSGIDLEKVRLKAVDKGLIKASDKPSKKEIFDFIFVPGFSTAQSLTEVSGRGVGLDVVRRKIVDLRGEVSVDSEMNVGTSFTLKIQQSLAIIDTLLFTVEDTFFIIPISEIKVCSQISLNEIIKSRHTGTIPYNNELIHFVDLREALCIEGEYKQKIKVIIIRNGDTYIALLADAIVGEHQAVLKPLGKSFRNHEYISSASQLGDGNLAFMIDSSELVKYTLSQVTTLSKTIN